MDTSITLTHYLTLSALLFAIGVCGIFLNRKNTIVMLMSIEIILLSIAINFVAFSSYMQDMSGQVFAMFIFTVAAAEAAIGLAILVVFYRNKHTIALDENNLLQG